ncbi:ISKra4 family transposase [Streptomyces mirabilis]|uniref:ISKra4 family transposase n=1 Tax=Streptomyces mirabilis TaxID=68239 RepID=UPI0037139810
MEPYDALPEPDPYLASRDAFERLISTLGDGPAADMPHDELEARLEQRGRELLRQLMQNHLDQRARKEEATLRADGGQPLVLGPEGQPRTWREKGHRRLLTCVFGPVRVTRIAYRGRGLANVHPADEALSLPAGRHSRGLARLAVLEAVRGSYDQAAAAIERRCGRVLGKRRLKELLVVSAVDIAAYYTANPHPVHPRDASGHPGRREGSRDAPRSPTRGHQAGGGQERGGRATRTPRPRREAQPQEDGDGGLRLRHRSRLASAARHHSSARRPQRSSTGAAGPESSVEMVHRLGDPSPGASRDRRVRPGRLARPAASADWIVLVDGARHQLDLLQAEATRRGIQIHVLLDFVHVAEYTWTAAHAFHPVGSREAETWAANKLTAILAGQASRAAAEMTAQATAEQLPATRRDAVTTCAHYLTGHLDQLHYDTALAAGWPIATGAVEGACRHLIVI